jgi:hypothetical protein
MSKLEDLSYMMNKIEEAFVGKSWFGGIATEANRKVLILVIDPEDEYKVHELKIVISEEIQELLDHHQMKLFFIKVSSIDLEKGEIAFLDNNSINEYQDEECDCEVCKGKKLN